MSRPARVHRLPKRTDYILIPAPLDLSLPFLSEKSPLPAIIVTPSSPSSNRDFSIAFLADPPKPSLRERLFSFNANNNKNNTMLGMMPSFNSMRMRSMMLILVVIFILVCHLVTHRLAVRRPYLDIGLDPNVQSGSSSPSSFVPEVPLGWFDLRNAVGRIPKVVSDGGVSPLIPGPDADGAEVQ